jgi:hypothetical protein
MDDKASEDRLEAAKLILQASEIRLQFLGDVQITEQAVKHIDDLKKELADLKKSHATYEVITDVEPTSGKTGKRTTTIVRKEGTNRGDSIALMGGMTPAKASLLIGLASVIAADRPSNLSYTSSFST